MVGSEELAMTYGLDTELMHGPPYNVLFLSKDNAGRSILAESLLSHWGHTRFRAFSAGPRPTRSVNRLAHEILRNVQLCPPGLRSKSWSEFLRPSAPALAFEITVCNVAAADASPSWPGKPLTAHWAVSDPSERLGSLTEQVTAFYSAFRILQHRIRIFTDLPITAMQRDILQRRLVQIGKMPFR